MCTACPEIGRNATRCAEVRGFHAWLKAGRVVRNGQKGFVIVAPVMGGDGNAKVVNIKPAWVFDVVQSGERTQRAAKRATGCTRVRPGCRRPRRHECVGRATCRRRLAGNALSGAYQKGQTHGTLLTVIADLTNEVAQDVGRIPRLQRHGVAHSNRFGGQSDIPGALGSLHSFAQPRDPGHAARAVDLDGERADFTSNPVYWPATVVVVVGFGHLTQRMHIFHESHVPSQQT